MSFLFVSISFRFVSISLFVSSLCFFSSLPQAARCVVRLLEKAGDSAELRREERRTSALWQEAAVARQLPPAQCAHLQVQLAQIKDSFGETAAALELYQAAIDAGHPRPSQIHCSRAYLFEQLRNYAAALREWDLAVSADSPVSSLVLESRGKFKLRRGDVAGAVTDFQEIANSENGSQAHGFMLLAMLAKEENNWTNALDFVQSALSCQPLAELIDLRLLQAELLCRLCRHAEALQSYSQIEAWYPNAIIVRKLRGNLHLRLGDPVSAKTDYLAATQMVCENEAHPVDELAANNLGCLLFWEKDYQNAVKSFDFVLAQSPTDFKALCNRAHACLKMSNFRQTLADYRQMQQLYPGSVSQEMIDALEQNPQSVGGWIGRKNVVFAREHSWEDWMPHPSLHCPRKPLAKSASKSARVAEGDDDDSSGSD